MDTGALHNRFAHWVAVALGLNLAEAEVSQLALGGARSTARTLPLELELEGFRWSAPASFCDPWPFDFHLLGQEGFFRFFDVRFRASVSAFEVRPDRGEE